MEFQGRIAKVLPIRQGVSERTGNEWKSLPFIFEYFESGEQRWSDKVLLETIDTNIMAQIGKYLKKGTDGKAVIENGECVMLGELKCKCGFSNSVRTFDKKDGTKVTINEVRMYKFEVLAQQPSGQPQAQQPAFQPQPAPQQQGGGDEDDLPF